MNSREKILAMVKNNQPERATLPDIKQLTPVHYESAVEQFSNVVQTIGGSIVPINTLADISTYASQHFKSGQHLVTTIPGISGLGLIAREMDPHQLETVELAVIKAVFGVSENGSVWVTENEMKVRVLPFICQHLAVVLSAKEIVHHMHEAYEKISDGQYGFGVFIAGPSKTADIEQSLVLGAHGPATMTIFLLDN